MKDKVVSWFLKKIVIPRRGVIDKPGYILMESDKGTSNRRQVLMPESILEEFEDQLIEEKGSDKLYSIGKKFGWRFASTYKPPRIDDSSEKSFRNTVYFIVRFVSATFAEEAEHELDIDKRKFEFSAKEYVVCRHNGNGQIMFEGGIPGVWAYMTGDKAVEGVKLSCQGQGDDWCKIVSAPREVLSDNGYDYHEETDLEGLEMSQEYSTFNESRETSYVENSLEDLIDRDFFSYQSGVISHEGERYFLTEVGLPYLLERELKTEDHKEMIFDAAFKHGERIASHNQEKNRDRFIPEYLSACGWGDTLIKEKDGEITVNAGLFPWTKFWEETDISLYRGLVSGLLTGYSDREVRLTEVEKDTKGEGFTVIVSE